MFYPSFTQEYVKMVMADQAGYSRDYRRLLESSREGRRIYHGQSIPIPYQGFFISQEETAFFEKIAQRVSAIGQKVAGRYLDDPSYRRLFRFPPAMENLILLDPGYPMVAPVGRYDIFYQGGEDFTFCEFNTDGSSAMNEDRVMGQVLASSQAFRDFQRDYSLQPFELFFSLLDFFSASYQEIHGRKPETAAIVDFSGSGTPVEFQQFARSFEERGIHCLICDPREMSYREGRLWGKDGRHSLPIDLVYRRFISVEYVEKMADCADFTAAYCDQAFTMFGSFRSQLLHSKMTFAVLQHPMTAELLDGEERDFLRRHLPLTRPLLEKKDYDRLLREQDSFLVKPYDSNKSQGVKRGRDLTKEEWQELINSLPPDSHIYQQFVQADKLPFLVMGEKGLEVRPFDHVLGLFLYGGHFAGCYARLNEKGLVGGNKETYTAPTFLVR